MKPFLTRYAVARTEVYDLPGRYNYKTSMWEVDSENGPVSLIRSSQSVSEIETKTFAEREKDDQVPPRLTELVTKTKVVRESDDEEPALAHSKMKTSVVQEREGNRWLAELSTKTDQAREKDDK